MPLFKRLSAASIALVLCVPSSLAASLASDLRLQDAVDAAMQRRPAEAEAAAPFRSSAWLAALPSVEVSYLRSDEAQGTDETDLGLNLPVKSPYLYEQDQRLRGASAELEQLDEERRRLFYSGLVREAVWSMRISATRAEYSRRKTDRLSELLERQQALFDARTASRYSLLLIRQSLAEARLELEDLETEARRWAAWYEQLTGLKAPPGEIEEGPAAGEQAWSGHPAIRRLDLAWRLQQATIAAGSERSAPWNLRVGVNQLESPALDETQFGVSLEVPLGFLGTAGESSRTEWREAARAYHLQRDELLLTLQESRHRLQVEAAHLQRRQALLSEAGALSDELNAQARALRSLNELGWEVWMKRLIEDLDRQSESAINALLIGQNRSMSRQAAGIPL